ncbi:MAG: dienelactone hydrolase family protein [Deltaproteobacteria bacterium]|nr:dienelactone hydrolase family protein [Deltaproteobacteria bacterium]
MRALLLASLIAISACSSSDDAPPATSDAGPTGPRVVPAGAAAWEKAGEHPVGHAIFTAKDAARDRTLTLQLWYPAAPSVVDAVKAGTPMEELVVDPKDRATMARLLAAAPDACTRKRVASVKDPPPAAGRWPVVAFSHCHSCVRFSMAQIAERLASHGFAVIAPDHAGDTVFDAERGAAAPLNGEFLAVRAADIRFSLDVVLGTAGEAANEAVPAPLRGKLDADKVGVFGHSYGAATTGLVLARDARPKAGLAIAAPMENDLLPPAKMAEIKVPALLLVAREDNSISEIGNNLMRSNFKRGNPPLFLLEVEDAGHWSFSDTCALTKSFVAGCGEGLRQTESGTPFFYLENAGARALAASYVTAFFAAHLRADAAAKAFLVAPLGGDPSGVVTAASRE